MNSQFFRSVDSSTEASRLSPLYLSTAEKRFIKNALKKDDVIRNRLMSILRANNQSPDDVQLDRLIDNIIEQDREAGYQLFGEAIRRIRSNLNQGISPDETDHRAAPPTT